MGVASFLRSIIGGEELTIYVEGTIVEGPTTVDGDGTRLRTVQFRLDACPDLRFQQVLSALAPERRRGDQVRAHYRRKGPLAEVQWVEKI